MKVQTPEIGGACESISGRDKGRLYLISAKDGETLLLCDGKYRSCKNPKRKNRRHVRLLPAFYPEISAKIEEGKDEDSEVRSVLLRLGQERAKSGKSKIDQ